MKRLLLIALLCWTGAAAAQLRYPATEVEVGGSRETLTGGRTPWRERSIEFTRQLAERKTLQALLRETQRFSLRDTQLTVGYYHPLSQALTGQIELAVSPEHRVLAKRSLGGQLGWAAGSGWVLSGGLRRSEYTSSSATLTTLGAERYFGDWRAGYTLYLGRPDGAGTGSAHRLSLSRYYGDRSYFGISFAAGREVENVGPPAGITSSRVRAIGIGGRHWFTPDWALSYELGAQEQGNLYDRRGLRLGVRHRF